MKLALVVRILSSVLISCSANLRAAFISHRRPSKAPISRRLQVQTSTDLDSSSTQPTLRTLYPSIEPYRNGSMKVSPLHTLQHQIYGNPDGLPALFLHGGPGAGCFPNHARFFDPDKYCIVLVNQRGTNEVGRGIIQENTLLDLVDDCEVLRSHLNVSAWSVVLGGSWGTTLALAYAQEYPDSIKSMILRGVCLLRPREVNWLLGNDGVAKLDPAGFQAFCQAVNATNETNVLEEYYHKLLSNDPIQRLNAARGWMKWEMRVSSLQANETDATAPVLVRQRGSWKYQDGAGNEWSKEGTIMPTLLLERLKRTVPERERFYQAAMLPVHKVAPLDPLVSSMTISNMTMEDAAKFIPSQAMLTCFYSVNHDYCMNHVDLLSIDRMIKLQSIPTIAIHGGFDNICPVNNALDLSEAWPGLEVRLCTKARHSMYDAAITNELIQATDRLAKLWETPPDGIFL